MTRWWNWVNTHVNELLVGSLIVGGLLLSVGCATIPESPRIRLDYVFCKAGIRGDYRVATQHNQGGDDSPVLFVFPIGGPYDPDHVICAISGDHAIMDLGIGKAL